MAWKELLQQKIPPALSKALRAVLEYDRYKPGDEFRLDYRNDYLVSLLHAFAPLIRAYFRYELFGLENIPARGRAVLVSNHGVLPVDAVLLMHAIQEAYGRWPKGLTDRRIFRIPFLRQFFMDLGIVLADPQTGQALLEREEIVLIMPGGAREAFKSSRERYKLLWKRRMGFVRLAIRTGAPIIPAVCIGIDETYHLLLDGYSVAEKLFGKEPLLPITLPIGLGPLPLPVKLTQYVGKPIRFRYKPEDAEDPAKVARLHRRVLAAMNALLDHGMKERARLERRESAPAPGAGPEGASSEADPGRR
jgi:1-acyl-sn-glycerol-3-phosphate acyltransferase